MGPSEAGMRCTRALGAMGEAGVRCTRAMGAIGRQTVGCRRCMRYTELMLMLMLHRRLMALGAICRQEKRERPKAASVSPCIHAHGARSNRQAGETRAAEGRER